MAFNPNVAYTKSSFVRVVRDGDSAVIWHSLFGYPKVVPVETLEFLESFSEPTTIRSRIGDELTEEDREAIVVSLFYFFRQIKIICSLLGLYGFRPKSP